MNIHEYQSKQLFLDHEIPVPFGEMASTVDEALEIYHKIGGVVAVKAQVHTGGRGKAGGIKLAKNRNELSVAAQSIFGMDIKGHQVRKILIEKGADILREAYLGILIDRGNKSIGFICSQEGGVDIEEVANTQPEKIYRFDSISSEFPEDEAARVAQNLFGADTPLEPTLDIMRKLFSLFIKKDCTLAEINPLTLSRDGNVIALDGKMNFDDNALFRQPDIEALRDMDEDNQNEMDARKNGLSFIQLNGDIGCMVNGAGLAMATMDMIHLYGGKPANFLDVGGSSNPEKVINAFRLILSSGKVKSILINIFGGITRCDDIARGILASFDSMKIKVPVVIRLSGTRAEEGKKLLAASPLQSASTFREAVQKVIDLAGRRSS